MLRYILVSVALLVALIALVSAPGARIDLQWNWANLALMKAEFSATSAPAFDWSGTAIQGYLTGTKSLDAKQRLLNAYQMRWRSASRVGKFDDALSAYEQGHSLSDATVPGGACTPPSSTRLETEDFAGVQAGSLNIPTLVADRHAVLLYSSQPISHTICLNSSGVYTVGVEAAHMAPPPVELQVAWDGWPAGVLSYGKGDGSFSLAEVPIATTAGSHTLTLVYANDFSDPASGIDRNAVIDYVSISRDARFDGHEN